MSDRTEHAVVVTAYEQAELSVVKRDRSPLAPNEVSGRTLATLISAGTELAGQYQGKKFPSQPGYSAAFQVEEVGSEVTDLKPGDLAYCMGGHRTWQRATRDRVLPVPAGVAAEHAVFARLMGVTMSTLTTTTARPPEMMVVSGLGLVGHLGAQIFNASGYRVVACDPDARRREIAVEKGLPTVLERTPVDDPAYQNQVALVLECSGHEQAALDGCRIVKKKGEVALVGCPWRPRADLTAHAVLHAVFHRYVVLRSGWEWELPLDPTEFRTNSIFGNFAAALSWLAEGRVRVDGLYTSVSPREAQQAYQDLLHLRAERLAVVFDWTSAL